MLNTFRRYTYVPRKTGDMVLAPNRKRQRFLIVNKIHGSIIIFKYRKSISKTNKPKTNVTWLIQSSFKRYRKLLSKLFFATDKDEFSYFNFFFILYGFY